MTYGKTDNYERSTLAECAPAERPLERICYLANRVEAAGAGIDGFIARFRGLPCGGEQSKLAGVPAGHEGELSRLEDQINRLENLVASLSAIG